MSLHDIDHPWETRERVLVAITGAPGGDHVIRRAARMAGRSAGELLGVFVSASDGLARRAGPGLDAQRRLLDELGGRYLEVVGDDVAMALVGVARAERATQLVLGASRRSERARALGRIDRRSRVAGGRRARRARHLVRCRGRRAVAAPARPSPRPGQCSPTPDRCRDRRDRASAAHGRARHGSRRHRAAVGAARLSRRRDRDRDHRRSHDRARCGARRVRALELLLHRAAGFAAGRRPRSHRGARRVPRRGRHRQHDGRRRDRAGPRRLAAPVPRPRRSPVRRRRSSPRPIRCLPCSSTSGSRSARRRLGSRRVRMRSGTSTAAAGGESGPPEPDARRRSRRGRSWSTSTRRTGSSCSAPPSTPMIVDSSARSATSWSPGCGPAPRNTTPRRPNG